MGGRGGAVVLTGGGYYGGGFQVGQFRGGTLAAAVAGLWRRRASEMVNEKKAANFY